MRRQHISYVLLATQILLVNLGESLHRLPFFGLHADFSCQCCTCDCSSTPAKNDFADSLTASEPSGSGNCPFCEFFEHYFALSFAAKASALEVAGEEYVYRILATTLKGRRFYWSRGPPASLFSNRAIAHGFVGCGTDE